MVRSGSTALAPGDVLAQPGCKPNGHRDRMQIVNSSSGARLRCCSRGSHCDKPSARSPRWVSWAMSPSRACGIAGAAWISLLWRSSSPLQNVGRRAQRHRHRRLRTIGAGLGPGPRDRTCNAIAGPRRGSIVVASRCCAHHHRGDGAVAGLRTLRRRHRCRSPTSTFTTALHRCRSRGYRCPGSVQFHSVRVRRPAPA